jgi:putative tributyrin esterase
MQYRVFLPSEIHAGQALPVVYLLHGVGGGFCDWSNYSDVSRFARNGVILVMPEGHSSYYVNSATRPEDRYEDYIADDLIADVESKFPAGRHRSRRAIVGVSMGGFGAIKLALSHPDLFSFAAGISPSHRCSEPPFFREKNLPCAIGEPAANPLPVSLLRRTGGLDASKS